MCTCLKLSSIPRETALSNWTTTRESTHVRCDYTGILDFNVTNFKLLRVQDKNKGLLQVYSSFKEADCCAALWLANLIKDQWDLRFCSGWHCYKQEVGDKDTRNGNCTLAAFWASAHLSLQKSEQRLTARLQENSHGPGVIYAMPLLSHLRCPAHRPQMEFPLFLSSLPQSPHNIWGSLPIVPQTWKHRKGCAPMHTQTSLTSTAFRYCCTPPPQTNSSQ